MALGTAILLGVVLAIKNAIARCSSEEEQLVLDRPLLNPAAALPSTEEFTDEDEEREGAGEKWIEVVEEEEENEDDKIHEVDEDDEEDEEVVEDTEVR